MTRKLTLILATVMALALIGCGDSESSLFLQGFGQNDIELQPSGEHNLVLLLSDSAPSIMYVDFVNPQPDALVLSPPQTSKFEAGDTQKTVIVRGEKATNGKADIVFTLRDTQSKQTFTVSVK